MDCADKTSIEYSIGNRSRGNIRLYRRNRQTRAEMDTEHRFGMALQAFSRAVAVEKNDDVASICIKGVTVQIQDYNIGQ